MLEYPGKQPLSQIETQGKNLRKNYAAPQCGKEGILLYGDNLTWLNVLLQRYSGKIDLVYIDPPYNTQGKFYISPDRASHISPSGDSELAYADDMDFFDYLEFMRVRFYWLRQLLSAEGSIYVHVDLKVGHYIKIILDEIFGYENFMNDITRVKSNPKNFSRPAFGNQKDVIYIYSRNPRRNIFNDVTTRLTQEELSSKFPKIDASGRRYTTVPCHAPGETKNGATGEPWLGLAPPAGRHWRVAPAEMERMNQKGLIEWSGNGVPRIKKFADEHRGNKMQDIWSDYKDPPYPVYPTEKNMDMLEMITRQSSNPESLILDAFCGSGSFLAAGMRHGRKVIGIDQSEAAIRAALGRKELENAHVVTLYQEPKTQSFQTHITEESRSGLETQPSLCYQSRK